MTDEELTKDLREPMPEPWPGAVVLIQGEHENPAIPDVYQSICEGAAVRTAPRWQMPGSQAWWSWTHLEHRAASSHRKITVLHPGTQPEPPYNSIVITISTFDAISAWWHGDSGWYLTGSTHPIQWSEVIQGAARVVVLSVGKQLKVQL